MNLIKNRKSTKPAAVKVCVLYDPKDGRVMHNHKVVVFPGAKMVDDKEVERRALERAARFGTDTAKLKALHVSEKDCSPTSAYRVDVRSLTLVKLPKPDAARR
jgi:nitroimidazol reductase NimA-like FMN-containing flavoprotein (pyridoxamine 5'-phosphate oxidase superfamily)